MVTPPTFEPGTDAIFWGHVRRAPQGCWLWQGPRNLQGYGIFGPARRTLGTALVHRAHWIQAYGPIDPAFVLGHLCHRRACLRLSHLELVTRRENTLRGFSPPAINARKTRGNCGHVLVTVTKRVCLVCSKPKRRATGAPQQAPGAVTPGPWAGLRRIALKHGLAPEAFT